MDGTIDHALRRMRNRTGLHDAGGANTRDDLLLAENGGHSRTAIRCTLRVA